MTSTLMSSAPDHVFGAAELLYSSEGTHQIALPFDFRAFLGAAGISADNTGNAWARRVLIPVVAHLLLPRITVPITLDFNPSGLPYRIVEIDGKGPHSYGRAAARRALTPFTVTLSFALIANLWQHGQGLREQGVGQEHATLALTAGFNAQETLEQWNAGTLDLDALRLLHALR